MKSRVWTLCLAAALGLGFGSTASAVTGCTNDWLNGAFAVQFSGTGAAASGRLIGGIAIPKDTATAGALLPVTGVMRLTLTPEGALSGYSWGNLQGGWVQDATLTGSFSVNTDCTASFNLTDASGATAQFSGVIVGQGDSVLVTQTDSGSGITGQMKRVRGFCQTSDLAGSFGMQYTGSVLGSSGGSTSSTGMITLDGNGGVAATEARFNGSKYAQTTSTGSINVNPDCSFSLSLMAADGSSVNFVGLVAAGSQQAPAPLLVRSDAGTAVSGSMIAQ